MQTFIDLEPILGTSDHIWDDFVHEFNNYPYRPEGGFVSRPDHAQSTKYLLKEYVKFKRYKEKTDAKTKLFHDSNLPVLPEAWTDAWNTYVQDTRITLVERNETVDDNFLPGNIMEDRIKYFPVVWSYIKSLPIKEFYSVVFINGTPNSPLPGHTDWLHQIDPCATKKMHMLFINPRNNRPFWYRVSEGRKQFVNSSLYLFNNAAAEHGVLAESHRSSLLRIYCALNDDFCDKLGIYKVEP